MWNLILESVAAALRTRPISVKIRTGHIVPAVRTDQLAASRRKSRRAARAVVHRQRRLFVLHWSRFPLLRGQSCRFFRWSENEVWLGHPRVLGRMFIAHPADWTKQWTFGSHEPSPGLIRHIHKPNQHSLHVHSICATAHPRAASNSLEARRP